MSTFPAVTGQQVIRVLRRLGFTVLRVRGSHHFLQHSDGRRTVVPVHRGETIGRGLMSQILKDCDLDRDHFHQEL
jgi:predicted RNA binding protein YcfA (HicA-like mRNA interferase family)